MLSILLRPYYFFFILASAAAFFLVPVSSAEVGQEFHIYKDGSVHMIEAEVIKKHALNFIRVEIWEQKWGVIIEYSTKFESAYGVPIKPEEIELGHRLEVKGRPIPGEAGTIEALYIRDLSVKKGIPPAESGQAALAPVPASIPAAANSNLAQASSPAEQVPSKAVKKITQELSVGMRGGEVIILQEFLQKYNWGIPNDGPVTGYFGPVTRNAVMAFQKAQGLEPVGKVDPKTRAAINAILAGSSGSIAVSPPPAPAPSTAASIKQGLPGTAVKHLTKYLTIGMRGEEVVILQEFLQKHGWGIPDDGPVTGYFGPVTESAVKKFQLANGLEAVGSVGPKTRALINAFLEK